MSVLTSKGAATLASSEKQQKPSREKVEFLKLKSGSSFKVAFLRDSDNNALIATASYVAHGDFDKHVYTHPCIKALGTCPSCDVGVPKKTTYLIAFLDLADGQQKVCELSRKQFNGVKEAIADYTADGSVFELAFKLSKTGKGPETVVNCTPILKPNANEKELLATTETPVSETFFDDAIGEPDEEYIRGKIVGYAPAPKESTSDPTSQF